jgi:hypothetical protein
MPDGHYVKCEDCRKEFDALGCFRIVPPLGRAEGHGGVYFLCTTCWDRMIGHAMMSLMR